MCARARTKVSLIRPVLSLSFQWVFILKEATVYLLERVFRGERGKGGEERDIDAVNLGDRRKHEERYANYQHLR